MTLDFWELIGFAGQGLFGSRFFVQWIVSERVRQSVIPEVFWYLSFAGGATLLAYSIHIGSWVFIVGQAGGLFIYGRNIYFIWRRRRATAGLPA